MKKDKIIIIILSLLLAIESSYLVYKTFSNNNEEQNIINDTNNSSIKEYTEEEIKELINSQDEILYKNKKMSDLTDRERNYIAFSMYRNKNNGVSNEFSVDDLKKYYDSSIYKNIKLNYQDIYDLDFNVVMYNLKDNKYTSANTGHGTSSSIRYPIYKKLVSMNKIDNTYTVEYQYVFYSMMDGPSDYYLYYTPETYNKEEKPFKTIELKDYLLSTDSYQYDYDKMKQDTKKYIEDNYNEIKSHLTTYVYTLESTESGLVLTNFITK